MTRVDVDVVEKSNSYFAGVMFYELFIIENKEWKEEKQQCNSVNLNINNNMI